ncbi:molybdenum ABC transporter ATP-binding protein, partial [Maribrevibacterium harenarium]
MSSDTIQAQFHLTRATPGQSDFTLDVDLTLANRGVTAIFGQSGSGKTTFLRCIAGLEKAPLGKLHVHGETWQDESRFVPTYQRPIGYVFQEASLFAHLTAAQNIEFAVKRAKPRPTVSQQTHIIRLMGLENLLQRYPHQLSGGERQRVAIARALLIQPRLLLMDEPLASLDSARKREILPYLTQLRRELDIPIFYVSHSVEEIAQLADDVVVLEAGKVIAQGEISQIFSRTDLPPLSGFDTGALWQGIVSERDTQWHLAKITCPGGDIWVRDNGDILGKEVRIRILARDVSLTHSQHQDTSISNRLDSCITCIEPDTDPAMVLVHLACGSD